MGQGRGGCHQGKGGGQGGSEGNLQKGGGEFALGTEGGRRREAGERESRAPLGHSPSLPPSPPLLGHSLSPSPRGALGSPAGGAKITGPDSVPGPQRPWNYLGGSASAQTRVPPVEKRASRSGFLPRGGSRRGAIAQYAVRDCELWSVGGAGQPARLRGTDPAQWSVHGRSQWRHAGRLTGIVRWRGLCRYGHAESIPKACWKPGGSLPGPARLPGWGGVSPCRRPSFCTLGWTPWMRETESGGMHEVGSRGGQWTGTWNDGSLLREGVEV